MENMEDMQNTVISELNGLLKGEEMAAEAYERYIESIEDDNVKKEFQQIQKEHKSHASSIAERIQTLGGKPEYNTGFAGFMATAKVSMKTMGDKSSIDILKQAYEGEYKGIAMAEELVKGDLDNESASLVQNILSNDQAHLKKMKFIMEGLQNLH